MDLILNVIILIVIIFVLIITLSYGSELEGVKLTKPRTTPQPVRTKFARLWEPFWLWAVPQGKVF